MIDPLDGTKEFINKNDEFCINIALIEKNEPVLGMIFAPRLNELYYAQKNKGFKYIGPQKKKNSKITVAISRFHHSKQTEEFIKLNKWDNFSAVGAAIKFGRIAIGEIGIYPRYEGSKEWDIAAGHVILQEAGGKIIDLSTNNQ